MGGPVAEGALHPEKVIRSVKAARSHMAVHPKARKFVDGSHRQGITRPQAPVDVTEFIARYGNELLASARRHSANAADADDAYQRGLEILLTKAPDLDEEQLAAWTHTVIRNEAMQAHRRKRNEIDAAFEDISETWITDAPGPDERLVDDEEIGQGREALKRIKPDQTRCLLLRAEGMDYPEICEITGFSYAKVNRCLSEGRKALRVHVGLVDSGAECTRLFSTLSLIADDQATAELRADADVHLANCLYCQATLRELRDTPEKLAAILPLGVAATQAHRIARIGDWFQSQFENIQARIAGNGGGVQNSAEVAMAKKVAAVVAITASVAGGGLAIKHATSDNGEVKKPSATPAAQAAPTTAARDAKAKRAREARAKRARERRAKAAAERNVPVAETASRVQSDPATPDAEPLGDGTAGDNQAAADPADDLPATAPANDGQSGGLAP